MIQGLEKYFTPKNTIIFLVLAVLGFFLFSYSKNKGTFFDGMENGASPTLTSSDPVPAGGSSVSSSPAVTTGGSSYSLRPVANPNDLLPKDENSHWGQFNTVNQTNMAMPDLLQAGYHIGLDSVGQSLRNANLQYRSDPIIPKNEIGPWNQSTIEPDLGRVPLEVGYGPR